MPWPPVTFAWVQPTETTFGSQHIRMDEDVLDFEMTHSEGNFPELNVTIKNPYRPFVGGSTLYWVWMGYILGHSIEPFFFGRLIATPDNIQDESITLKFLAKSRVWLKLKQYQSDLLRQDPYDPILVNVNSRADPDTVLEFRSAVWHFDRLPTLAHGASAPDLNVSISDILIPENGFLTFAEWEHFYKAFNWKIGQQPLQQVLVRTNISWTQAGAGFVDIPTGSPVSGWTGGSIVSGWPKPGSGLAGGYTVAYGFAFSGTEFATATSHHWVWENMNDTHQEGDTMSEDVSWTTYSCTGERILYQIFSQSGVVDPWSSTTMGGEPGVNIPLHVQWSELLICWWIVYTTLGLEYDVRRPRQETMQFTLTSDLQPVFVDIHEPASVDTETLTLSGGDVSLPIINTLSWYTLQFTGQAVQAGTYAVSTPEAVGGPYYAVAINSGGTVGTTEPAWTLALGSVITDGGVHWAMVGATIPNDYPIWRDVAGGTVVAGTVIRAQFYLPPPVDIFGTPIIAPPAGTSGLQVAIVGGTTQMYSNGLNGVADLNPSWPEPRFSNTIGATTVDNTVTWMSLGTGAEANPVIDIPLGLNSGSRWYFPLDRGQRTIRAAINAARAKLRMRARVIKLEMEIPIERALNMDCKTGVIVFDHRLPGGYAYAKITSYTMTMNGDKSAAIAKVTAEASPGLIALPVPAAPPLPSPIPPPTPLPSPPPGTPPPQTQPVPPLPPPITSVPPPTPTPPPITSPPPGVTPTPGIGVYALAGYMQLGYQQMTGGVVLPTPGTALMMMRYGPPAISTFSLPPVNIGIATDDVGYTPPSASAVVDDNVTFPISDPSTIIVQNRWVTGRPPGAPEYVPNAVFTVQTKYIDKRGNVTEITLELPVPNGFAPALVQEDITDRYGNSGVRTTIFYFPVTQYFLELQNLNKPFANTYFVQTTHQEIPEMVDLSAAAHP
jgi:hypothetical protein